MAENDRGSMAARRLLWLLGKADISNVRRILDIGIWHLGQSIELVNIFPHALIDAFRQCLHFINCASADQRL